MGLIFTLFSFITIKVGPDQFLKAFNKNISKFEKTNIKSNLGLTILYLIPDYQRINYFNSKLSEEDFEKYSNTLKKSIDFRCKIFFPENNQKEFLKNGSKHIRIYEEKLKYFSFHMQRDISLIINQMDTIPCSYYNFERTFDNRPHGLINLSFSYSRKIKDLSLIISEKCFIQDTFIFNFSQQAVQELPKLRSYKKW